MSNELRVWPDAKGRVCLGAVAKGIDSYRVTVEANGRLVLDPLVAVSVEDAKRIGGPKNLADVTPRFLGGESSTRTPEVDDGDE